MTLHIPEATVGPHGIELNQIQIGRFTLDLFETEVGALGITVYDPTRPIDDENAPCRDIFVNEGLEVHHC